MAGLRCGLGVGGATSKVAGYFVPRRLAVDGLRPEIAIIDIKKPPTHTHKEIFCAQEIRRGHPRMGELTEPEWEVLRSPRFDPAPRSPLSS